MNKPFRAFWMTAVLLIILIAVGQGLSFFIAPASWKAFIDRLPVILSMIAFWGPIMALFSGLFVWATLRLLGFNTLEEIRQESIEQNNPTPAIVFVGALIASLLFFLLIIRP
jgi:hypothetical protein